ncbi:MAG: 4a-hydroxytetrahydrobiopterin dehydratase [Deltaproteobacteria bacterium]|nr:4a-hydroxytetrahydrobiopterin dehydratase [Deltaproteobacteria bacterium]
MPILLEKSQIDERLSQLEGWARQGQAAIEKSYVFADFKAAMRFVNQVAEAAEKVDHHPDILINYNKVKLTLSTHSEGGLTHKDFDLARDVDFI